MLNENRCDVVNGEVWEIFCFVFNYINIEVSLVLDIVPESWGYVDK
jgi:hypothetical protein